jgi:hypothetical protein
MLERIKPMPGLVNEMLNKIPKKLLEDKNTTFFDPAIGGGQFVREIEQRLKENGDSNTNIRKRVFGSEYNQGLIDIAVNMNNLVGQYKKVSYEHFFKLNNSMQFDVIVGNPPFQDSSTSNSDKLWPIFLNKSLSLVKPGGYQSFVSPPTFTSGTESLTNEGRKNLLKVFTTEHNLICLDYTAKNHFSVGSRFVTSLVQVGVPYQGNTEIIGPDGSSFNIDLTGVEALPIPENISFDQVNKFVLMQKKTNNKFYFKFNDGKNISYSDKKDKFHKFFYFNASSNHQDKWGDKPNSPGLNFVHLRYNGSSFGFDYALNSNASVMHNARTWVIPEEYKTQVTDEILKSVFESELFKETVWANKFSQYNEPCFLNKVSIPPLDRVYTNAQLKKWYGIK